MYKLKIFLGAILAVATLASLYYGAVSPENGFALFMAFFAISAAFNYNPNHKYDAAYACVTACTLGSPTTDVSCDSGGIRRAYWAKYSDIDWATMVGSSSSFDSATREIKTFTMLSSAVFKPLSIDAKTGKAEATYNEGDGFYSVNINLNFMGQSAANRLIFDNALSCSTLVIVTIHNNGKIRCYGVDYDSSATKFFKPLKTLRIGTHLDASGTLGNNDKTRDELTVVGESLFAPLFCNMAESAIPVV